jgi:phosphoribosylglycinamide formyltransferase 1
MQVAVLVSGTGSNLQALLTAQAQGQLGSAKIAVVISNVANAPALAKAAKHGVAHVTVEHKTFPNRETFDQAIAAILREHNVELVVLAGFMRILSPWFVQQFAGRIINTHPSLLPAFVGKNAPQQALDYGAKLTGVSIHFVDESLDGGPIIVQRSVAILTGDTAQTLHQRIQQQEHEALPQVVSAFANGAIRVDKRTVTVVEPP